MDGAAGGAEGYEHFGAGAAVDELAAEVTAVAYTLLPQLSQTKIGLCNEYRGAVLSLPRWTQPPTAVSMSVGHICAEEPTAQHRPTPSSYTSHALWLPG